MDDPNSKTDGIQNDEGIKKPISKNRGSPQTIQKLTPEERHALYCPAPKVCPEKCDCYPDGTVDCGSRGLTHVPFNIPQNAVELRLHTNQITKLPNYAFSKLKMLTKLDICNNHISEIEPYAFSGLEKLTQLNIYSNQIEDLPVETFKSLSQLNILLLSTNKINCLRRGLFDNVTHLRLLSLFGNKIRSIEDGTFNNIKSTSTLHLGSNPLICDCNLKWISFMPARVSSSAKCDYPERVAGKAVSQMDSDEFICEGGERERTASAGSCFIDLPCPENCHCHPEGKIDCSRKGLKSIPMNLPKYTIDLDLSGNKISKVLADGSFKNLPNLRKLDLSDNRIAKIELNAFDGAYNLHELDLKKNELTHVEDGVFESLKNLTSLELRENYFKCVKNTTFTGLRKLSYLSLADNTIKTIEINAFENLPLYTLNLLGNHLICNCYMQWFNSWLNNKIDLVHGNPRCQQPSNLKDLPISDLNNNDLSCDFDDQNACIYDSKCPDFCTCDKTFVQCREVSVSIPQNIPLETTHLAINSALIQEFNPADFEYLPNLEILDLSHNFIGTVVPPPVDRTFKGLRRLRKLNLSYNYIKCIQPETFQILWELEELILNSNAISQIFDTTFENMTHIKKLDISGNPIYCDCNLKWLAVARLSSGIEIKGKCSEPERTKDLEISHIHRKEFTCMEDEPPAYVVGKCNPCSLKPCNGGTCKLTKGNGDFICECQENHEGRFCEKIIDYCYEKPCQNGGQCKSHPDNNKFTCTCPDGYHGNMCEKNVDDCVDHQCQNGGKCVDGLNEYTCGCGVGYRGSFCEIDIDICESSNNPCQNGGVCVDMGSDYQCHCQKDFTGKNCEQKNHLCLDIDGTPVCKNNAMCQTDLFGYQSCVCEAGFSGAICDQKLFTSDDTSGPLNDDACESKRCIEGHGRCAVDTSEQAVCKCFDGFSGEYCEHVTSMKFNSQFSSVHANFEWRDVKNFTFVGVFKDDAGIIFSSTLKNVYTDCSACFLTVYIRDRRVGVSLRQSNEGKVIKLESGVIIARDISSKFSVRMSQRYLSIEDQISRLNPAHIVLDSVAISDDSFGVEQFVFGHNSKLPKKALEHAQDTSIGCVNAFYYNSEQFFFEKAEQQSKIESGICVYDDAADPNQGVLMDTPVDPPEPRICGEQKDQTVFNGECKSTRTYNIVAECPATCRNMIPSGADGQLTEIGAELCCRVTRYREYSIRFECPNGKKESVRKSVFKKCECEPC